GLRALRLGYTKVSWYRGGLAAWRSAAFTMESIADRLHAIQGRLWNAGGADAELRRNLAIQLDELVAPLLQVGNPADAYEAAKQAHDVLEKLAAAEPDNLDYQLDRAISSWRIGDALKGKNDPVAATAAYREGLAVAMALTAKASDDVGLWRQIV